MARGRLWGLAAAVVVLVGCSSPEQKAAADSCLQFQDAAVGFLATTGGYGWTAVDVEHAVEATPEYFAAAARTAPGDLAAKMRHAADLADLHGQTEALGGPTGDVSRRIAGSMAEVQAACARAETTIDLGQLAAG